MSYQEEDAISYQGEAYDIENPQQAGEQMVAQDYQGYQAPPQVAVVRQSQMAPPGHGPSDTEKLLENILQMLIMLTVLLGVYWAAVVFLEIDDILGMGFGENYEAEWNAYLSTTGGQSNSTANGGRKLALIINITYKDWQSRRDRADPSQSNVKLPGTSTDAERIEKYLKSQGFATAWLRDDYCTHGDTTCSACMSKKTDSGFKMYPSKRNLEAAFRTIANTARAGDVLWVFFAGHGSQAKDTGGDEADGMDEGIVPADYDKCRSLIRDDWLKDDFRNKINRGAETVAVFDCCHSGTMFDLPYKCDTQNCQWDKTGQTDYKNDGFFFYLSGCQDNQTAKEIKNAQGGSNGAMTTYLCKMIRQNKLQSMNIREFLSDLRSNLAKRDQIPNICCTEPFPLQKTTFKQMFDGEIPKVV